MNDWLQPNLGKVHLNPDPPNGIDGQCVNAASSWSIYQGLGELRGATAWTIWQTGNPNYDKITSGYRTGDTMFFLPNNPSTGTGSAGHVDMFVKEISGGFQGADTNWNDNPTLQYINHSLVGIAGAFRPKGQDMLDDTQIDQIALGLLGRPATGADKNGWRGKNWFDLYMAFKGSQEHQDYIHAADHPNEEQIQKAFRDNLGRDATPADIANFHKVGWYPLHNAVDDHANKEHADYMKKVFGSEDYTPVTEQLFRKG